MDHYCPWTNNAIGVRNHKFFILFIFYTFVLCAYALAIVFGLALHAPPMPRRRNAPPPDPLAPPRFQLAKVSTIAVTFAALLFGLFTACMLGDQWSVLRTNVAKIDRLKGEETECASDVNEVFGGRSRGFRLDWLIPTAPVFPASVHDDIMGYHVTPSLKELVSQDDDLEAGDTARSMRIGARECDEVKTELNIEMTDDVSSQPTHSTTDSVRSRAVGANSKASIV